MYNKMLLQLKASVLSLNISVFHFYCLFSNVPLISSTLALPDCVARLTTALCSLIRYATMPMKLGNKEATHWHTHIYFFFFYF